MHEKITKIVIISATPSGSDHQLIPQDSCQRILWERRNTGVNIRPRWKIKVRTVIGHLILQFLLPKGITQCKRDLRVYFRLINGITTFSFFASKIISLNLKMLPPINTRNAIQTNGPLTRLYNDRSLIKSSMYYSLFQISFK